MFWDVPDSIKENLRTNFRVKTWSDTYVDKNYLLLMVFNGFD